MTNQVTVLEPSQQTLDNLDRLKSIPPHLNLSSTELSKGNNSGIIFPQTNSGSNISITGAFDVAFTPTGTIKVYDSSNESSTYAGYLFAGNTTYHLSTKTFTAQEGIIYLELYFSGSTGTATISFSTELPTLQETDRRWFFVLANITQDENNMFVIHKQNMPGNVQVCGRWI